MRSPRSSNRLLVAAAAIMRALDPQTPSRVCAMYVLSQALLVFEEMYPSYEALCEHPKLGPKRGRVQSRKKAPPAQADADIKFRQGFEAGARSIAEAAFWCLARLGGRGGPIRRRAMVLLRKVAPIAGPAVLMRLGDDGRSQLTTPRKVQENQKGAAMIMEQGRAGISSALLLLAQISDVSVAGRISAADSVYLMLSAKLKQKACKNDLALSIALINESFTKTGKKEERIYEKSVDFASSTTSSTQGGSGVGRAVLVAQSIPHLRSKGPSYCGSIADACARNLKACRCSASRKAWAVALGRSIVCSLLAEQDIANYTSSKSTKQHKCAPDSCSSDGQAHSNSTSSAERNGFNDALFEAALTKAAKLSSLRKGDAGALWAIASILRMWYVAYPSGLCAIVHKGIKALSSELVSHTALVTIRKALLNGVLNDLASPFVPEVIDSLLSLCQTDHFTRALSVRLVADLVSAHGLDLLAFHEDDAHLPTNNLIDTSHSALSSSSACVRFAGVRLISSLASAAPQLRAPLLMAVLQNLRIADLQLVTTSSKGGLKSVTRELAAFVGNSSALGVLIEECAKHPNIPSALLLQCSKDAVALFDPHPLAMKKIIGPEVCNVRRLAGWTLLAAIAGNGALECLSQSDVLTLLVNWRKELTQIPLASPTSKPSGGWVVTSSACRAASLKALSRCIRFCRTSELEAIAKALLGAAAARLAVTEARISPLALGGETALDPLNANAYGGAIDHGAFGISHQAILELSSLESKYLLQCMRVSPPEQAIQEVCQYVTCSVAVTAHDLIKMRNEARGKDNSRTGLVAEGCGEEDNVDIIRECIALVTAEESGVETVFEKIVSSADALAASVTANISTSAPLLDHLATEVSAGSLSPLFSSIFAFGLSNRLSVDDIRRVKMVLPSLQRLLRYGLKGVAKFIVDALGDEISNCNSYLAATERFIGMSSWKDFSDFFPDYLTEKEGMDPKNMITYVCMVACANAYQELGHKVGKVRWIGLVEDVLQVIESLDEDKRQSDHNLALRSNALFALGALLDVIPCGCDGKRTHEVEEIAVKAMDVILEALHDLCPLSRTAASFAIAKTLPYFLDDLERILITLAQALSVEKAYGTRESESRIAENWFLGQEAYARCWNGMFSDNRESFAVFGPEGTGITLGAIGKSASQVIRTYNIHGRPMSESARSAAYEIAFELMQWDAHAFPKIVTMGLECLSNIWAVEIDAFARTKEVPEVEFFLRPEFAVCTRDLRSVLGALLCVHESNAQVLPLLRALVRTVRELVRGVGCATVLRAFPSLVNRLFFMVSVGVSEAHEMLKMLATTRDPGATKALITLAEWLDSVKCVLKVENTVPLRAGQSTEREASVDLNGTDVDSNSMNLSWRTDSYTSSVALDVVHASLCVTLSGLQNVFRDSDLFLAPLFKLICLVRSESSLSVLKTLILKVPISFLKPYAEQIASTLRSCSSPASRPSLVVFASEITALYLLKRASEEDHRDKEASALDARLFDALIGDDITIFPLRYGYDRFAELVGARATLVVAQHISMLRSGHKDCDCSIARRAQKLHFIHRALLADFAHMIEPSGRSPFLDGSSVTRSGISTEMLFEVFESCIAELSFASLWKPPQHSDDQIVDSLSFSWVNCSAPGALLGSGDSEDIVKLAVSILTWKALNSGVSPSWTHENISVMILNACEYTGAHSATELLATTLCSDFRIALHTCEALTMSRKSIPKALCDMILRVALLGWARRHALLSSKNGASDLSACISVVLGLGYLDHAALMLTKVLEVASPDAHFDVHPMLESAEISELIVNILTKPVSFRRSLRAKILKQLCSLASLKDHRVSEDRVQEVNAWAALCVLLKIFCELDQACKPSLLSILVTCLLRWNVRPQEPLASDIIITVAQSSREGFRRCIERFNAADRSVLEMMIRKAASQEQESCM